MYAGFIFIGVIFGLTLALTVGLFYVLSLEGEFQANVHAAAREVRDRVTGRRRYQPAVSGERRAEPDPRVRSLQEELRVANRLMEQIRTERQTSAAQTHQASEQTQEMRQAIVERDLRIVSLEEQLKAQAERQETLRQQLADRSEQLSRSQRDVRDLRTELDVLQSGVNVVSQ